LAKYRDLVKQREELEKQIAAARQHELDFALKHVHQLIADFELTPEQVFPTKIKKGDRKKNAGRPKYRDPVSGST
jgi:DNA-binding protein H-NS